MDILERVDGKILEFFTKISHKFQRLTGRTNFFLARLCLSGMAIGLLLSVISYWIPLLHRKTNLFWVFVEIFVVLRLTFDVKELEKAEEQNFFGEVTQKPILRLLPVHNHIFRVFVFAANIFLTGIVLLAVATGIFETATTTFFTIIDHVLTWPAATCFCYFAVVTPMPPGKSKIREWVENFASGFRKPAAVESRN
ncbi:MAG: hypothetical protein AAB522_02625 [Patescibacteria group bacterium]